MTAYGLSVEHYEKYEVIWNGKNGTDIFFQNEMPYDPPDQADWMATPATTRYPAFLITHQAAGFHGYGMGSYTFFNKGVPVFSANAFEMPTPLAANYTICSRFSSAPPGRAESLTW